MPRTGSMFEVEFKQGFFDRAKVERAISRAERAVLSRFGAFVRTRAITSMRWRKGVSDPGSPPSAHLGLIRQFLFFAYEPEKHDVIIGPALIGRKGTTRPISGGAMGLLERGGEAERIFAGQRRRLTRYQARPFMRPALEKELQIHMPGMFKDSVKE